jgi:hypothetical protein
VNQADDSWEPGATIRVLVANLPLDLADRVTQLVREQADMQLAGAVDSNVDLLLAAADGVDVVILGASPAYPLPAICTHLLGEFTRLRIIVVEPGDQSSALIYWLGLRRQRRQAEPLDRMLASIRSAHRIDPLD